MTAIAAAALGEPGKAVDAARVDGEQRLAARADSAVGECLGALRSHGVQLAADMRSHCASVL